jgi:hypothetical protein
MGMYGKWLDTYGDTRRTPMAKGTFDTYDFDSVLKIKIVHRKTGLYDVYVGEKMTWAMSRMSPDNILAWLSSQEALSIQFEDEEKEKENGGTGIYNF